MRNLFQPNSKVLFFRCKSCDLCFPVIKENINESLCCPRCNSQHLRQIDSQSYASWKVINFWTVKHYENEAKKYPLVEAFNFSPILKDCYLAGFFDDMPWHDYLEDYVNLIGRDIDAD